MGRGASSALGREARALGSARPWAWTEGAGRAEGAAGPGGRSAEPNKGSGVALALGNRAPGAQAAGPGGCPLPSGPAPCARTCPARFFSSVGICRRYLSGSGGDRDRDVCRAPAGRGARERRKFPSRVWAPDADEWASPACSARGRAGRREHGQRPERARTAGLGGQLTWWPGGGGTTTAAAAATGASGLPGPRRSGGGRRSQCRGKDPRPVPLPWVGGLGGGGGAGLWKEPRPQLEARRYWARRRATCPRGGGRKKGARQAAPPPSLLSAAHLFPNPGGRRARAHSTSPALSWALIRPSRVWGPLLPPPALAPLLPSLRGG